MMIYEMYCCGQIIRDRSAGGTVSTSLSFCGGCRQRPVSKIFKKNSGSCELGSKFGSKLGRGVNSYASALASSSSSSSSLFPTSARAAALNTAALGNVK